MIEKEPLFSIIIPVYNLERYIEECVKSILLQDYTDYEVILVDDGSYDKSPEICDKLANNYSRVKVIHKDNGGVSTARRRGTDLAKGKYIICVDGDDWISENCLGEIANIINFYDVDIVCHGLLYDNGTTFVSSALPYRKGIYNRKQIENELFPLLIQSENASYFIPSLCGKAIKRSLLVDNLLDNPKATIGEDGACVIPCVFHSKSLYVMDECFYYYRLNQVSATKSKKVFNWEWPKIVAEHIEKKIDIKSFDFTEQLYRKITHDFFSTALTQFYSNRSYFDISKDIRHHLEENIYLTGIRKCKFKKSFKAIIMGFTLKHRLIFPIFLLSKIT